MSRVIRSLTFWRTMACLVYKDLLLDEVLYPRIKNCHEKKYFRYRELNPGHLGESQVS